MSDYISQLAKPYTLWPSLVAQRIYLQCGRPGFNPWVGKIPGRRERLPTPVFLPGEFHGLCSPWDHKELDTTEQLSHITHISYTLCCCCCCWVISVVSDPVRPHRRQPTRLPCPWDSPSKNTGMGCHFLLQCMKVKSESEVAQSCPIPSDPMDCSLPGSSVHGIFPGKSTGVGCGPPKHHSLENQQTQTLLTLYSPRNFTVSETVESLGQ